LLVQALQLAQHGLEQWVTQSWARQFSMYLNLILDQQNFKFNLVKPQGA
jgi:hypothetical protein